MNDQAQSELSTALLLDPKWLAANMSSPQVKIIDCRPRKDYQLAHIPGATGLPIDYFLKEQDEQGVARGIHMMSGEAFEALMGGLGVTNDSAVVSYDDNRGKGATRLWWVLKYFGHSRSGVLDGGWRRWTFEHRPVTTETSLAVKRRFVAKANRLLLADLEDVRQAIGEDDVQLVDCRSAAEYSGTDAHGNKRLGHIPGARLLEWSQAIQGEADTSFRPLGEIQRCVDLVKLEKTKPVITYCQSGIRACHVAFSLTVLGFKDVRVYDASMAEWANREDTLLTTKS